jgi:hypothetical protein
MFAQVDDFLMYDLVTPEGYVCEDVFAYSNNFQGQRSLVIYHNRYAQARGWIKESAPYSARVGEGREMRRRALAPGLGLEDDERAFTIFRDQVSGLEYLRSSRELHQRGLYVELGAYQHHAFVDFGEVRDGPDRTYAHLNEYLGGRGVPSVEAALKDLLLRPAHEPFRELVSADLTRRLLDARAKAAIPQELLDEVEAKLARLHEGVLSLAGGKADPRELARRLRATLEVLLVQPDSDVEAVPPVAEPAAAGTTHPQRHTDPHVWAPLIAWVYTHRLGELGGEADVPAASRSLLDEWQFSRIASGCFRDLGLEEGEANRASALLKLLVARQEVFAESVGASGAATFAESLLRDRDVQTYLGVNRFRDVLYFSRDGFDRFLEAAVPVAAATPDGEPGHAEAWAAVAHRLRAAAERSGFRLEGFVRALRGEAETQGRPVEDLAPTKVSGD